MSLYRGPLTYRRLFVGHTETSVDPLRAETRTLELLTANAFVPMDPEGEATERAGWCRSDDAFDLTFTNDNIFFNDFINLGLRIDRWAIPSSLLRAKCREAEAAYLVKKGRDRITKKERAEIKDMVARKLRAALAPTTRLIEVSWDVVAGVVRVFSHSDAILALVGELFQQTFFAKLTAESPYVAAVVGGRGTFEPPTFENVAHEAAWAALEPTIFVSPEGAR
jgi:hypothetical protein